MSTQALKQDFYLRAIRHAALRLQNQRESYFSMSNSAIWPWKKKEYQIRADTAAEIQKSFDEWHNFLEGRGENEIFTPWYDRDLPQSRIKGTVTGFSSADGWGWIVPQGGGSGVHVHISAVERAGLSTLNKGQTIEYEVVGKVRGQNEQWEADKLKEL